MAQLTSSTSNTLDAVTKEDLGSVIFNTTPFMTPFTSGIATVKATNDTHEWLTDSYAASVVDNAVIEADTVASAAGSVRTRLDNHIQIADKTVSVTKKAEFMDRAGVPGREMAYQLMKKGKELQMDVEKQTLDLYSTDSIATQSTASVAGISGGVGSYIVANIQVAGNGTVNPGNGGVGDGSTNGTSGTKVQITQAKMDTLLDGIWDESGDINNAKIMGTAATVGIIRNTLSGLADSVDANVNASATAGANIISRVAVYVSQFGTMAVVPNKHCAIDAVYVLDFSTWALAVAGGKKIHTTDIATSRSAEQKLLECYYTLEARSEQANGLYMDVAL